MSVNAYLKGDTLEITTHPQFNSTMRRVKGCDPYEEYHLFGSKITLDKGRWYIYLDDRDTLPQVLLERMESFSARNWIPSKWAREAGLYTLGSATAEVMPGVRAGNPGFDISVVATSFDEMNELIRQIKAGSIRPSTSYECTQSGLSYEQMHVRIVELEFLLEGYKDLARNS